MSAVKELSWEPIKRGSYYCAPACGGKCKIVDYDRAGLLAARTIKRLGPNWKPHIFENLGWHSGVIDDTGCWYIAIRKYSNGLSYTAFLGTPYSYAGKWAETANTPEKAIEKVRKVARDSLSSLQQMLDAAQIDNRKLYTGRRPR